MTTQPAEYRLLRALFPFAVVLAASGLAAPPAAAQLPHRVAVSYGQAFAPPSVRFAELGGLSLARDFRLTGRLGGTAELHPFLLVNQTKADRSGREKVGAVGFTLLTTFDVGPRRAPWGLRLEAGSGVFYGFRSVPAVGSPFNFFDVGGARIVRRLAGGRSVSIGYRWVHISNLGLISGPNPGLTLNTATLSYDWGAPR